MACRAEQPDLNLVDIHAEDQYLPPATIRVFVDWHMLNGKRGDIVVTLKRHETVWEALDVANVPTGWFEIRVNRHHLPGSRAKDCKLSGGWRISAHERPPPRG